MIKGFEDKTYKLTPDEERSLAILVQAFSTMNTGQAAKITSTTMIERFKNIGVDIGGVRLRKLIQHIRVNNLVSGVCSDSKGYWIADNKRDYETTLQSLYDRISHQTATFNALKKQYVEEYGPKHIPKPKPLL